MAEWTTEEVDRIVAYVEGLPGAVAPLKSLQQAFGEEEVIRLLDVLEAKGVTPTQLWSWYKSAEFDPVWLRQKIDLT